MCNPLVLYDDAVMKDRLGRLFARFTELSRSDVSAEQRSRIVCAARSAQITARPCGSNVWVGERLLMSASTCSNAEAGPRR